MAAFRACGAPAYMVLVVALLGVMVGLAAIVGAAIPWRRAGVIGAALALGLGVACLAIGAIGMYRGRALAERAVQAAAAVHPAMKARIVEQGYSDAAQCIDVGTVGAWAPAVLGLLALVVARARTR